MKSIYLVWRETINMLVIWWHEPKQHDSFLQKKTFIIAVNVNKTLERRSIAKDFVFALFFKEEKNKESMQT